MSTTTTALEVIDRRTGELVDLREAPDDVLARMNDHAQELKDELALTQSMISAELVRRLDRSGEWTRRVTDVDTGLRWEIKAPSPTAGTVAYRPDVLRDELRALLERDVIDVAAAENALARTISIVARAPFHADLAEIVRALRGAQIEIAGVPCTVETADSAEKVAANGVKALAKVPGTGAAIKRATVKVDPGERKAKIKAVA